MDNIYGRIQMLMERCNNESPVMPPTILFNESWMLRALLSGFESLSSESKSYPLSIPQGCRWYSEALIPSAFSAKYGKDHSESWTHADGVIGHFNIGAYAKGDLSIPYEATHLVVLEAKMFSKLSAGVKNAPYFNQAARNAACIAEVLRRGNTRPENFNSLGFYVLAPASQINQGVFNDHLKKDALQETVKKRISEYGGNRDQWFSEWFLPTMEILDIRTIAWEDTISFLAGHGHLSAELESFYMKCVEFNKPPKGAQPNCLSHMLSANGSLY